MSSPPLRGRTTTLAILTSARWLDLGSQRRPLCPRHQHRHGACHSGGGLDIALRDSDPIRRVCIRRDFNGGGCGGRVVISTFVAPILYLAETLCTSEPYLLLEV